MAATGQPEGQKSNESQELVFDGRVVDCSSVDARLCEPAVGI
jgi:hypothetical protein